MFHFKQHIEDHLMRWLAQCTLLKQIKIKINSSNVFFFSLFARIFVTLSVCLFVVWFDFVCQALTFFEWLFLTLHNENLRHTYFFIKRYSLLSEDYSLFLALKLLSTIFSWLFTSFLSEWRQIFSWIWARKKKNSNQNEIWIMVNVQITKCKFK